MTKSLPEAIDRLQQMPEDRQDLLARLVLHEIEEDEKWTRSTAAYEGNLQAFISEVLPNASRLDKRIS